MHFRRDPYHELAGVAAGSNWLRHGFTVRLHISHNIGDQLTDAVERRFRSGAKPTQAGEFGAQADMLLVVF